MRNLKTIFAILFYIFYYSLHAQDKEILKQGFATFKIIETIKNGRDLTPIELNFNAILVLYKYDDTTLYLSYNRVLADTQSYGRIFSIIKDDFAKNENALNNASYQFQWNYKNSFDTKEGTARVKLFLIYENQRTYFVCTILHDNKDVFIFRGIMKGNLSALESNLKK